MQEQQYLLSHSISSNLDESTIDKIRERIEKSGNQPYVTAKRQFELLNELCAFDLGRFLLQNQGLNGYWTHYILTHPWFGRKTGKNNHNQQLSHLENFLLDRAPITLATQQRFEIFLKLIQKEVKNKAILACIPCGMMGELLYLNFKGIENIRLIGMDYDANTLNDAKSLAKKQNLSHFIELIKQDAWQLNEKETFDLISSNGLNMYVSDDNKVMELYQQFYNALKPNGKLITSILTPPPSDSNFCEWNFNEINQEDLLLQKIVLADIVAAKWQYYRSEKQTKEQLTAVGFKNIEFIYDKAHVFPTISAIK